MPKVKTFDARTIELNDPVFRYPVDYIGLTRGFTAGTHGGADCGWNASHGGRNQPVYAPGNKNTVRVVKDDGLYNGGYGNYVTLDSDGFLVLLAHLKQGSVKVRPGDILPRGTKVGNMNNSGNSFGDHLHYEIYLPGCSGSADRIDPLPLTYAYFDQTVSADTACKESLKYLGEKPVEPAPDRIGKPGVHDGTKEYIEINTDNLRARNAPSLNAEILGYMNKGKYNVMQTADKTREAGNGYLWYMTSNDVWCAGVVGVNHFPARTSPDKDWSEVLTSSERLTALARKYVN